MKKHLLYSLVLAISISVPAAAQHNFVVQNGSASAYKTINDAYAAASTGDTIYLPGGSFNMPSVSKSLVWIGVGYNPDSTAATYHTRINNQVNLSGLADNSYFTGIHFSASLVLGSNGDDAKDVTISRCRISGNLNLKYNDATERNTNTLISETIIDGSILGYLAANNTFEKCVIRGTVTSLRGSYFDRIINSLGGKSGSGYTYFFNDVQNCLVSNSVFPINGYTPWGLDVYNNLNNTYLNNIFEGTISFPAGTNTGSGNLTGVSLLTVFENIDGLLADFSYLHDFHMKPGSPGIGAGTGGTDISIYGGTVPFKEGGLPFTPHINHVDIATETVNGLLRVEIGANSQNR